MKNLRKIFIFAVVVLISFFFVSNSQAKLKENNRKNFYRSLASRLSKNREDYKNLNDYEFANFRIVNSTGIVKGNLYRSSSPVKAWGNRNIIADEAAKEAGIKTFINLADDYKSLRNRKEFLHSYYSTQKIICLNLNLKFKSQNFQNGVARAVNFMANNSPPYLIHCDLGKDWCGIFCAVIESLMGASSEEIVKDYMISFYNYFGITPDTDDYEFVADNEIRSFLASIFEIKDIKNTNLTEAATRYLLKIGVSLEDIEKLRDTLSSPLHKGRCLEETERFPQY